MTIRFLIAAHGYQPNDIASIDPVLEVALVAQRAATLDLTGGKTKKSTALALGTRSAFEALTLPSGRVIGAVNPRRPAAVLPIGQRIQRQVAVIGDSTGAKTHPLVNVIGASVVAGVLTVPLVAHTRIPGEPVNLMNIGTIGGVDHSEVNNSYVISDVPSADTFTVDLGNPSLNGAVVGVLAGGAFQYSQNRDTFAEGVVAWAMARCGDRLVYGGCYAIGGAMLARTLPSCFYEQAVKALDSGVKDIVLKGGVNDATAGRSDTDMFNDWLDLYNLCQAYGAVLWDCSTVALGTAWPTYGAAAAGFLNKGHRINTTIFNFNKRRRLFAQRNPGVVYVRVAEELHNPADNTGATLTAYQTDGVHENAAGGSRGGAVLARAWMDGIPPLERLPGSALQGACVSPNPLFSVGAEAAGLANGWVGTPGNANCSAIYATSARTDSADGDNVGRNQVVTITATGASSFTLRTSGSAAYKVTDVLQALADIRVSNMAAVSYVSLTMSVRAKNHLGIEGPYTWNLLMTGAGLEQAPLALRVSTLVQPFPVTFSDAAAPNAGMNVVVGFSGAGGAVLTLARAGIDKVFF